MAKNRMINTRFWIDDYISNLDPVEKLLFLYCLTNPYTDICGIYEIPVKHIAMETGLDKDMVIKILKRFEDDHKIIYIKGWIGIVNFTKHQQKNPKVTIGIENGLKQAPKELVDRLSIDYDRQSHFNSNLNLNSNTNIKIEDKNSPSLSKKKEQTPLIKKISYLSEIPEEDLKEFCTRFSASPKQIKDKAESLKLYCQSKGKVYKDYKAFLLNAIKKDFSERQIITKPVYEEIKIEMTPEQKKELEEKKKQITRQLTGK